MPIYSIESHQGTLTDKPHDSMQISKNMISNWNISPEKLTP